jgi:hypothetical protein
MDKIKKSVIYIENNKFPINSIYYTKRQLSGRLLSDLLELWLRMSDRHAKIGGEMDKIYLFDDNQTDRIYYTNELSEADHDVAIMKRSPFLTLIDKNTVKKGDRRAHKRFQVKKEAVALIRPVSVTQLCVEDRSMGEIACAIYRSKPVKFGRINTISVDGLSFDYITGREQSGGSLVLDILLADCGFYLPDLTFKSINDVIVAADYSMDPIKMRRHHVRFERLAPAQIRKIQYFIQHYSDSVV